MKTVKIFNLLLIVIQIGISLSFKCGTDDLKIKPKTLKLKSNIKASSILKDTAYTAIKIGYDFTTLSKPSSMTSSTFETVKSILKETRTEFSKILKVQHYNIDLSGSLNYIIQSCELSNIGEGYKDFLIDNDVIIFPSFRSLSNGALAAAAPCLLLENHRPVGGVVYINNNLNFNKGNANFYMKNILLHEITHILAFHPEFFRLLNMNTTENGISYIKSSGAVSKARQHFGCSSLTKIPLENQGGSGSAGSHWESRFMLGDYMISTDHPDAAISDITLALFEDTGFYQVNYYSGGLFKFGKNKGCSFSSTKCIINEKAAFDEFCDTSSEAKCSSSRALKSSCYITRYNSIPSEYQYFSDPQLGGYSSTNYCPVPYESHSDSNYYQRHCRYGTASESLEKTGESSFCFMSSIAESGSVTTRPVCYEVSCDTSNNQIIITVGSAQVTCSADGTANIPSSLHGTIECPKYSELCSSSINGKVYNDMYNTFTKAASNAGYSYPSSFNDYTGDGVYDDDDSETINPVTRNDNYNIKINIILLAFGILLFLI